MLRNDTKKIIDDARDTLVGQIPVPMMQCQQITLALTYKFMSDDDEQSVELGGRRHYFTGALEQYGWDKIVSRRLDDTQRSELYRAGLNALQESESMPSVFREIFKDAMVPYGDHRTLALFLNIMNGMEYDDSEKLGDAYEYLLKTAEAQADAGQFRTPRHIIDFIVKIINPQKHEVIIDPACGTAGFLVSSYQHVKSQHELPGGRTTLSTPDLTRLADNLNGYDISPEMTKLAMANMYLHTQDKNPNIANYDTLTSTDHWNDYADVMLANPPFMTPKGGIRPHSRFRVPARRAEVLFVDYIASHLNEHGRAGIIVPEGIIFQSQNAYRQLRRFLLDESLIAVISLPGGVFQPYSGVKTSILILDKVLAPRTDCVAFFKVENDGYDLGAQRRPIDKDDLPTMSDDMNDYLRRLRSGESLDNFASQRGLVVAKERIAEDGEYNLSGERYRDGVDRASSYPMVRIKDVASVESGFGFPLAYQGNVDGEIPFLKVSDMNLPGNEIQVVSWNNSTSPEVLRELKAKAFPAGTVIFPKIGAAIGTNKKRILTCSSSYDNNVMGIVPNAGMLLSKFLYHYLLTFDISQWSSNAQPPSIRKTVVENQQIPLPPLEAQRELVAEIESYQRVIDGARQMAASYHPRISVDPIWPVVKLPEACEINPDTIDPKATAPNSTIFYADISSVNNGDGRFLGYNEISSSQAPSRARRGIRQGDVLLSTVRPNLKAFTILRVVPERAVASTGFAVLRARPGASEPGFILASIHSDDAVQQMVSMMGKGSYPSINQSDVASIKIPLPPLEVQRAIVAELDEERAAIDHAERLATKMEQRINGAIARVWMQ